MSPAVEVAHRPVRPRGYRLSLRELYFLHYGAQRAVEQHEHRIAVALGKLKGIVSEVHRLLYGVRRQNHDPEASVSKSFCGLEIVLLRGLDAAKASAAPAAAHDDRRQHGTRQIGNALCLQAHARTG